MLAGLLASADRLAGKRVALTWSGGNASEAELRAVLREWIVGPWARGRKFRHERLIDLFCVNTQVSFPVFPRVREAMMRVRRKLLVSLSVLVTGVLAVPAPGAAAGVPGVARVGEIDHQDVASKPGSEPDTLVEPSVAVSPWNPEVAVAAAHDGRYPDGGAVDISYAWTRDGGRTWGHAPVPGLTTATGGVWDRASDPVVAFGPDGTVYLSTLVFDTGCPSGVAVSRSTDGGRTFGAPVLAHESNDCAYNDDKNWLVADNGLASPHRGRLYQFWTPFLSDAAGNPQGSPQVVRWSDDHGRTWSPTATVSAPHANSQNSQPMIRADGSIVDTFLDYGPGSGGEGPEHHGKGEAARRPADQPAGDLLVAVTSRDGGATWSPEVPVTHDAGEGPGDVRCCLPAATIDAWTGTLYAAWEGVDPSTVRVSSSRDGTHWSTPVLVSGAATATTQRVNVGVVAHRGRVYVSYGTRDTAVDGGRYVQQRVTVLDGTRPGGTVALGPPSDLTWSAVADGEHFPGDYIGIAAGIDRVYAVWCRSSAPPTPETYHQTLWAAVLRG